MFFCSSLVLAPTSSNCEADVSSISLYSPFYDKGLACRAGRLASSIYKRARCAKRANEARHVSLYTADPSMQSWPIFKCLAVFDARGRSAGYSLKFLVGVCPNIETLTLFQTKICDFSTWYFRAGRTSVPHFRLLKLVQWKQLTRSGSHLR